MPLTSTLEKTPPPLPGKTVDNTLPSPGGNLAVVTDSETSSGFSLSWDKGSDDQTAEENLKYLVYISDQDNITGVSDAENNGTLLNPDEADQLDRNTYQVTGQSPETQYWATVILKDQGGNKSAYGVVTATTIAATAEGEDSQAGDEAWAEAFSASVTGLDATWDGTIDFDVEVPTGLTVVDGRVTAVDLRGTTSGMGQLSGSIDIPEWENLKSCALINLALNAFDSQYPSAIHKIGASLEYLYISYSDGSLITDGGNEPEMPHEIAVNTYSGITYSHVGKSKGNEDSIIRGSVPDDIDNLSGLKYFHLGWTDEYSDAQDRSAVNRNGIESVSANIWNITTLESINVYQNYNIKESGNTFNFPATISHLPNLQYIYIGGGNGGGDWDENVHGLLENGYPSDMDQLTNIESLWCDKNANLSGFPDLRNCGSSLKHLNIMYSDTQGNLPSWALDGRFENLDIFSIGWPASVAMDGQLPAIGLNSHPKIDIFDIVDHNFSGAIPANFWTMGGIGINKINLGQNNFTSLGTTDLTGQRRMSNLRYYDNDVGGENIPKLNWSDNAFTNIRIENNRYVFADFLYVPDNAPAGETAFELYFGADSGFNYAPQKAAGQGASYELDTGQDFTIDDFNSVYSHADNSYQWYKDGDAITGATSRSLSLTNVDSGDAGTYTLQVTNSTFESIASANGGTNMTLTSQPIDIEVT